MDMYLLLVSTTASEERLGVWGFSHLGCFLSLSTFVRHLPLLK